MTSPLIKQFLLRAFRVLFVLGLSLPIIIFGHQFLGTIVALSHWIQPRGAFPDVSRLDLINLFEAAKIVLLFFVRGGSLHDPIFVQTSWPSSFIRSGIILLTSGLCLACVLFGRSRIIVGTAVIIGSLLITTSIVVILFSFGFWH